MGTGCGAQAGQLAVHPQREEQLDQRQAQHGAAQLGLEQEDAVAVHINEAALAVAGCAPVPDEDGGHRQRQQQPQQPQELPGFGARGEAYM